MPNRVLREGFVDSEAVASLTDWTHRVYSNLIVKADDAGRFDGRLEYLRSHLFPVGVGRRTSDIAKAVKELVKTELVIAYEYAGKPFLQVTKWQRCGSAETSRYPWRDGSHGILYVERQTRDGAKDFVETSLLGEGVQRGSVGGTEGVPGELNTETETETETKTDTRAPPPSVFDSVEIPEGLDTPAVQAALREFEEFRRKRKASDRITHLSAVKIVNKFRGFSEAEVIAAIDESIASNWTGVFPKRASGAGGARTQSFDDQRRQAIRERLEKFNYEPQAGNGDR